MYTDTNIKKYFHGPLGVPPGLRCVIVLQEGEQVTADAVMWEAFQQGATYVSWGNDQLFWVVFPDKPNRAWDFTAASLRRELAGWNRKVRS